MAGDWIPITIDLIKRRETLLIADEAGVSAHEVVGWLVDFWGWVSRESSDGKLRNVFVATLVTHLSLPECFFVAMKRVGWLIEIAEPEPYLVVSNWDRWLSNSAKARLGNNLRQREYRTKRNRKVATNDATKTLPQKRREEYIKSKPKSFSVPSLEEVSCYCQERNNTVDPQRFIDHYTANGWRVGKNPMRDWKAAIRTWEKNNFNEQGPVAPVEVPYPKY